ncbi:MAG: ribonuclease H-like domain-containing protein [Acidobacteria bacterium]|nr:ribonuclease H-like domain-containing protein [Acidobacteriota bacterium]MBS1866058.1 ribonuclease H-like domain-containing protein [Acidobacteriota bacterium]
MSTSDKFARLSALKPVRSAAPLAEPSNEPMQGDEVTQLLGGLCQKTKYGQHLTIRNWYSSPEFSEPAPAALDLLTRNKDETLSRKTRAALENPERWLFLDTETTGLAGGTGTYAFLTGIAWWDAGGLQVEQFFMRDFTEEHSVLCELAARIAERPVLVTYNGKTFDWPLLESRFTMTRRIPAPKLAAHLDLLHPARALWKLRLGSVRLTDLERQVLDAERLGWRREDDVASALIPQFYFDYLRGGSAAPLAGVVRHNQMDLRGLAALFGKINTLLSTEVLAETDGRDLFGLSRFLHRRGESPKAEKICVKALEAGLPAEHRQQASRDLALMAKRRGDHAAAAELWKSLLQGNQSAIEACEQLAIYFERREKNIELAAEYVQLGLAKLRSGGQRLRDPFAEARILRRENSLLRRLARLEQRLATSRPQLQPERSTAATAGRLL